MSSLVPEEAIADLEAHIGEKLHALSETERLALITASTEGVVNHARLREICAEHPADISKILAHLVRDGLLEPDGTGRGMVYFLPWQKQREDALFDLRTGAGTFNNSAISPELGSIPLELKTISPELSSIPLELPPQYLDWNDVPQNIQAELLALAAPIRGKRRAPPELLQQTILNLCKRRYLGRRVLAHVLSRHPDDLLKRTLAPMVDAEMLTTAFASTRNPRQAYMAADSVSEQAP